MRPCICGPVSHGIGTHVKTLLSCFCVCSIGDASFFCQLGLVGEVSSGSMLDVSQCWIVSHTCEGTALCSSENPSVVVVSGIELELIFLAISVEIYSTLRMQVLISVRQYDLLLFVS